MKAELDIKPFLKAINEFRAEEQQPCGVQVVERVGLRAGIEHIDTLLAAVFAEEVSGFGMFAPDGSRWRRGAKVNAGPWVGLRLPCVPVLTYSTTSSK